MNLPSLPYGATDTAPAAAERPEGVRAGEQSPSMQNGGCHAPGRTPGARNDTLFSLVRLP